MEPALQEYRLCGCVLGKRPRQAAETFCQLSTDRVTGPERLSTNRSMMVVANKVEHNNTMTCN
eukprot:3099444-Amphidinium_carterae.2